MPSPPLSGSLKPSSRRRHSTVFSVFLFSLHAQLKPAQQQQNLLKQGCSCSLKGRPPAAASLPATIQPSPAQPSWTRLTLTDGTTKSRTGPTFPFLSLLFPQSEVRARAQEEGRGGRRRGRTAPRRTSKTTMKLWRLRRNAGRPGRARGFKSSRRFLL